MKLQSNVKMAENKKFFKKCIGLGRAHSRKDQASSTVKAMAYTLLRNEGVINTLFMIHMTVWSALHWTQKFMHVQATHLAA